MNITLFYPHVARVTHTERPTDFYKPYHARFAETLRNFNPGVAFKLHVTFCGEDGSEDDRALYGGIPNVEFGLYLGGGWDIGSHQHAVVNAGCEMAMCFVTPTYFWRDNWLKPFADAWEHYGEGLYGASASYQHTRHIRTGAFCLSPAMMRSYPWIVSSREETAHFESGVYHCSQNMEKRFTNWIAQQHKPVKMVAADGVYDMAEWRTPPNIFRRGDQSNVLTWDRHVDIYREADAEEKVNLERWTDGV